MSQNTLLFLQSLLITLQMVNAGLGTTVHNPTVSVLIGAVVGGFTFYVQQLGNQSVPPPPSSKP